MAFSLGAFAGGISDGYNEGVKRENTQADRDQQDQIDSAYGNTLASVFGAQAPAPPQPSLFQRISTGAQNLFGGPQDQPAPQPLPANAPPSPMPNMAAAQADPRSYQPSVPSAGGALPGAPPLPNTQATPSQPAPTPNLPAQLPQPGSLNLQQIVQRVTAVNPGAPASVIAGAVDRFRPFMNDQSKAQWQQLQMDMRQQQLDLRQQSIDNQDRQRTTALGQGAQKIEDNRNYRDRRLGQMDTQEQGRNQRAADAEEGRNNRTTLVESGRDSRFQQQQARLENSLQTRVQQAEARLQQAKSVSDRAAAIREWEGATKEYRDGMRMQMESARTPLIGQQKADMDSRIKQVVQGSMARLNDIKRRMAGGSPTGTPGSPYGGLGSPPPASYPDRDADQGEIERSAPVQNGRAQQGKVTNRAPTASAAPPASAQQADAGAPPAQAFEGLAPGQARKFSNGQVWTLKDGQPVRVQ
jgi:hypothetical protein